MKKLRLIAEEPFRLFFPLGVLAGIWGAMLWPMYYAGWLDFYPGFPTDAHARLMVEGMIGAFLIGFLGTAFPRMTDNRHLGLGELGMILLLWLATVLSLGMGKVAAGDAAFAAMCAATVAALMARWIFGHRDTPPPGFVVAVLVGLAGGGIAAGLLARDGGWWMGVPGAQWARLWLHQGMALLPLLGIGAYLLPRFFGLESSHELEDSPRPPAGWWPRLIVSLGAGALIFASCGIEAFGHPAAGQWLRAATVLAWFVFETPIFRHAAKRSTPGTGVRWAVISILLGLACAAIWPIERIGSLHLVFVSGFAMALLTVGGRVTLGHAGRGDLANGKLVWMRWVIGLAILAATTRMSSDFLPKIGISHHIYAAWTWAATGALWLIALRRFFLQEDPGE